MFKFQPERSVWMCVCVCVCVCECALCVHSVCVCVCVCVFGRFHGIHTLDFPFSKKNSDFTNNVFDVFSPYK